MHNCRWTSQGLSWCFILCCSSEHSDSPGCGAVCGEWGLEGHLHHLLPSHHCHLCGAVYLHVQDLHWQWRTGQHLQGTLPCTLTGSHTCLPLFLLCQTFLKCGHGGILAIAASLCATLYLSYLYCICIVLLLINNIYNNY